jgi:hypothetical protein
LNAEQTLLQTFVKETDRIIRLIEISQIFESDVQQEHKMTSYQLLVKKYVLFLYQGDGAELVLRVCDDLRALLEVSRRRRFFCKGTFRLHLDCLEAQLSRLIGLVSEAV